MLMTKACLSNSPWLEQCSRRDRVYYNHTGTFYSMNHFQHLCSSCKATLAAVVLVTASADTANDTFQEQNFAESDFNDGVLINASWPTCYCSCSLAEIFLKAY